MHQSADKPNQKSLSPFVLSMMITAIVIGLEGLPDMASYGLSLVTFYVFFAIVYFIPITLVTAELGAGWPGRGGIYLWIKTGLGKRMAFLGVWCQWMQVVVWYPSVLAFATAAIAYMFDPDLAENWRFLVPVNLSVFWVATLLNFGGLRWSGILTTFCLYVGTLFPLLLIIIMAVYWLISGHPSQTPLEPKYLIPDLTSVGRIVMVLMVFSFLSGLEVNAVHFRRTERPKRSIPLAVFISFVIILSVSILGALAVAIFVPINNLELQSGPLQVFETFFHEFGFEWALPVMAACVAIGAIGHIIVWIIGPTEALSVAAHDGVVPPFLQGRNSAGVPVAMLLVQGVVVTALSIVMGMININAGFAIVTLVSGMVYLVMYALMFITCLVLRYKHPHVERSYKIPGGWIGIWLLVGVGTITCIAGIVLSCFPPEATTETAFVEAAGENWKLMWVIYTVPAFVIIVIVPFIIYAFRRPHWAPPEELLAHENVETSAHQKEVH